MVFYTPLTLHSRRQRHTEPRQRLTYFKLLSHEAVEILAHRGQEVGPLCATRLNPELRASDQGLMFARLCECDKAALEIRFRADKNRDPPCQTRKVMSLTECMEGTLGECEPW